MLSIDPRTTALVLIDLQKGIVGRELAPHKAETVVKASITLAERFRAAGAPVVLVNVGWSADGKDTLRQPVDNPPQMPRDGYPAHFMELAEGLEKPGDLRITKRQWGAFHGTELDLQLRRRGITTIVLGGVATNIGVESTARAAYEHGYAIILAEDITTGMSAEMHEFAIKNIFPRISRVTTTAQLDFAAKAAA